MTAVLRGQLDIFGAELDQAPAPSKPKRQPAPPAAAKPRWTKATTAGRECGPCWSDQDAAIRNGGPVPRRRQVAHVRTHNAVREFFCAEHGAVAKTADSEIYDR